MLLLIFATLKSFPTSIYFNAAKVQCHQLKKKDKDNIGTHY